MKAGENMKFVHIADLHLDSPFLFFNNKTGLGDLRRLEQRNALSEVIEYIKNENIECLFISGDLYEQEYVKESTIQYIDELFRKIPNTKIFISPGNHDPFITNSFYNNYNWSDNVIIFNGDFNVIENAFENTDVYGMGFTDYYLNNCNIHSLNIKNPDKINILIMHADLNASKESTGLKYNPVSENELNSFNFDYIALGHIHCTNYKNSKNIIYPGSLVSLGFDELGKHGMIVGEINKNNIKTEFIPIDKRCFEEIKINISEIKDVEELIEKINTLFLNENNYYKLFLEGNRNFIIDTQNIFNQINQKNILKIEDNTKIKYNIEEISKEISLRGFFVQEALKKLENEKYSKEEIEKAIEIGLDAM